MTLDVAFLEQALTTGLVAFGILAWAWWCEEKHRRRTAAHRREAYRHDRRGHCRLIPREDAR